MLRVMNLDPGVEMTLFNRSFAVMRSEVLVETSPGLSTQSPPMVSRTRHFSTLRGRSATTTGMYVAVQPGGFRFI